MYIHHSQSSGLQIDWPVLYLSEESFLEFFFFFGRGQVRRDPFPFVCFIHKIFQGSLTYKTNTSWATWAEEENGSSVNIPSQPSSLSVASSVLTSCDGSCFYYSVSLYIMFKGCGRENLIRSLLGGQWSVHDASALLALLWSLSLHISSFGQSLES